MTLGTQKPRIQTPLPQVSAQGGANSRKKYGQAAVYALTAPPLLFLSIIQSKSKRYQHFALTLLVAIFGTVCIVDSGDALRHQLAVEYYYSKIGFSELLNELWQVLRLRVTDSGARDTFLPVIGYLTGGVLGAPFLFFPLVATIYGYFFAGSVVQVLQNIRLSKVNYVLVGLIFVFLFIRGIDGFYTVRTWTGMWVLVYACLRYHETRRLRFMILMFVPPLIHFGFLAMAIPAWIVLAFGTRALLYSGVFVISTFSNFLPSQPITEQLAQTERGEYAVSAYLQDEDRAELEAFDERRSDTNFYNAYRQAGLQRWAPTFLVFTLLASGIYIRYMTPYQRNIFSIGVLMLTFSNLTWFLYALHNRTLEIGIIFILAGYLHARLDPRTSHHFRGLPPYYQWGLNFSLLLFAPLLLFHLSMFSERLNIWFFIAPFISWMSPELDVSVKEVLRKIL